MRFVICFAWLILSANSFAKGQLTSNIEIDSQALGYKLQYRVYTPDENLKKAEMPVLFVTDGPGYINRGRMNKVADRLLKKARIEPSVIVFVDPRNPEDPNENRRNAQFFCNQDYFNFYKNELIPALEQDFPIAKTRESRSILGVSFGGLNAACFGLLGSDTFSGIAMHSPATHPIKALLPNYERLDTLPLRIFLSTGVPNDNTAANRKFRDILEDKGYPLKYIETDEGHNWRNWAPLIDDVLLYFYGVR
jgi:enterochelin esterase-like enzyme